jgi:hypothetical protein
MGARTSSLVNSTPSYRKILLLKKLGYFADFLLLKLAEVIISSTEATSLE